MAGGGVDVATWRLRKICDLHGRGMSITTTIIGNNDSGYSNYNDS